MKPVLIQSILKKRGRRMLKEDDIIVQKQTPISKFIFWGLAAIILLSLLLA